MCTAPFLGSLLPTLSPARIVLVCLYLCSLCVSGPNQHAHPNQVARDSAHRKASAQVDIVLEPAQTPFTFVSYGDTQFTDLASRKSHSRYRAALLQKIAAENPALLLIAGDVVQRGAAPGDWRIFDRETAPLRERQVRIFPVLGNHDLAGNERVALANYFQRFPQLRGRRWYTVRLANCYFVMIDTEADHSQGSEQYRWMKERLAALPAGISYVFLVSHRPLHTRASGGFLRGSPRDKEWASLSQLLEETGRRMGGRMFAISGHVHNYERYEQGGVTYIVSGGGVAAPHAVRRTAGDFYRDPAPTYHYCRFTVSQGGLRFEMVRLLDLNQKETPTWAAGDSFKLGPD